MEREEENIWRGRRESTSQSVTETDNPLQEAHRVKGQRSKSEASLLVLV